MTRESYTMAARRQNETPLANSILVIGGGIIGTASALRLRAAGFDVTLIDPGDARRGASFGNAGHIGAEQCDPWPSFYNLLRFPKHLFGVGGPLDFRVSDTARWLPWSFRFIASSLPKNKARGRRGMEQLLREPLAAWQRLFALANVPSMVRPCGHFVVWMSEREAAHYREIWSRANIGTASFRDMSADELSRVGSGLRARPIDGIAFTGTGQLSQPQGVRDALTGAFKALGGKVIAASVSSLEASATRVVAVCNDGAKFDADEALNSAGAWSGALMAGLGVAVPLIAERGYHLHSPAHSWPSDLPPVVFEERSVIVTRFTDGLRMTSFLEFGSPDAPADPRKWARLKAHIDALGIEFSKTPERWMAPRPTLPDYLPAIGRLKSNPRVMYAFGHQHLGMTLAAVTSEWVERIATGNAPAVDLDLYRVERFA